MKTQNGVTLVELIVALFIATLVFMGIFTTVNTAQRSSSGVEKRVAAQQDVRGALELMAMEIQMASYNPDSLDNIWLDHTSANCASPASTNLNFRGIRQATASAITIEMDINNSGSLLPLTSDDNPNEIITYVYDLANRYITRSTNCGNAFAFLGDTAANQSRKTVLVVNDLNNNGIFDTGDIPVFRYFNGAGTDITATVVTNPTDLTVGIPAIRRIQVTLVADTADVDAGSGVRRRIVYSTSVIPRNHFATVY